MWLIYPQIDANLPRAGSKLLPERRDGELSEFRRRGGVSFVECSDGHGSTAAIAAAFVFGRRPMSRCVARHAIRARVDAGVCVHTLQQVLCGGNGWGGCHALGLCGGGVERTGVCEAARAMRTRTHVHQVLSHVRKKLK